MQSDGCDGAPSARKTTKKLKEVQGVTYRGDLKRPATRPASVMYLAVACQVFHGLCGLLAKRFLGLQHGGLWFMALYYLWGIPAVCMHIMGHTRFIPAWFVQHTIDHHCRMFPPSKFMRSRYQSVTPFPWNLNLWMYVPWPWVVPPMVFALAHHVLGVPAVTYPQLLAVGVTGTVYLIATEIVHTEFHKMGSMFDGYNWFEWLRWVHYIHHKGDMKHNYGIIDMACDMMIGTYMISPP